MPELDPSSLETWSRLDWNDIRIFLAVAETGSLSQASRLLGLTQPTIGRRMEELETHLGARLMSRTPRGVLLTPVGEALHRLAAGMGRLGEAIARDIAGKDGDEAGQVTLAATDGVATYMLAPHLGAFHAAHPEINLAVDCGLWHGALEAEPDLVLEYKDDARADQTSVPIAHVHYAYFASREYLATYGVPTRFSDVINHRFVRHAAFGQQKETWNPKGVAVRQLVNPTLVTNASGTMVEAVRGGAGIGAMPTVVATLFPELVMLDLGPVAQPTLWLRHHASAVERGRVRRVVDWLTRIFDPAERPWYRREFVDPKDFPREQRAPGVRVTSDESRRSA